jgi:hypothetical protein
MQLECLYYVAPLQKAIKSDGFVKSPYAALSFKIPFGSLRAGSSTVMVSLSNHARLASGAFYKPVSFLTFYKPVKSDGFEVARGLNGKMHSSNQLFIILEVLFHNII